MATSARRWLACFGLGLHLLTASDAPAATITVTEQQNGQTLAVTAGDVVEIVLGECASCGFTLTLVSSPDPSVLQYVSHTITPPGGVGGTATHRWRYAAASAGSTSIQFRYGQEWDPSTWQTYRFSFVVSPGLAIDSFFASPDQVTAGESSTLHWSSTGGSSAAIAWPAGACCVVPVPLGGSMGVTPEQTTTYTLTVTGPGGSATAQATVTVTPQRVTLSPSSLTLSPGTTGTVTATLSPTRTSATTLTLASGNTSVATVPASVTIPANTASAAFTVSAGSLGTTQVAAALPSSLGGGTSSTTVSVVCPAPQVPQAKGPAASLPPGSAFTLTWSDVFGSSDPAGVYEAHLALDSGFSQLVQSQRTAGRSATFSVPSNATGAVSARVRAIAGCGKASGFGDTVTVGVAQPPATVILSEGQSPAWAVARGGAVPPATLRLRNVGQTSASVSLSAAGGFFSVGPSTLSLGAGQEAAVTLTALAGITSRTGLRQGSVTASWPGGTVTAAVTLTVSEGLSATVPTVDRDVVYNLASGGGVTTQTLAVSNPGSGPITVGTNVLVGGSWLSVEPQDLLDPLLAGQTRAIRLRIDRSARTSADGPPPVSAQMRIFAVGSEGGRLVKVFDAEPPAVGTTTSRTPSDPRSPTFIVPTAVHSAGQQGSLFTSDGWIRNLSASPVTVDLLATPASGGPSLKVEQTLPGLSLVRLYDFVQGLFGQTSLFANVEVRPRSLADASQLVVRITTDGQPGGGEVNQRYSSEIPVYASGSGTGVGLPPLVMAGVDVTPDVRTNIILSETSGSPASVHLTLLAPDGTSVARTASPVSVGPYGVTQSSVQSYLGLSPGTLVQAATLLVKPDSGPGRVVALGTAIDNVSQSFRALTVASLSAAGAKQAQATELLPVVIPSIVHAAGLSSAFFTTRLSVTNETATEAALRFVYAYGGTDEKGEPVSGTRTVDVTVAPRGSLPFGQGNDAVTNLLGLPSTWSTNGPLRVEGPGIGQCLVTSWVQTADPASPQRNLKYAEIPGFNPVSAEVIGQGFRTTVLSSGLAKVEGRRTNLILTEVSGQPAEVRLRLIDGATGLPLGQTDVLAVSPYEKRQVNDASLWGLLGLGQGMRDRLQMVLETVGSGAGRVAGILTEIASDGTNATLVTPFRAAGPQSPGIWVGR